MSTIGRAHNWPIADIGLGTVRRNPLVVAGAVLGALLILLAIVGPFVAPYPADAVSATHPNDLLLPPSAQHWFGTDAFGRDILSRVLIGTRLSLSIVALVLIISLAVGLPLGLMAGYFGGWIDNVLMRFTDVFLAFPPLLLALALVAALRPSISSAIVAISITWWPWYARLARGQATAIATRPFIESARALGLSPFRIVWRHVTPNALTPVIVQVSLDVGGILLTAAALSYLGLGAQDPSPEWGLMVNEGQSYFTTQWWLITFPGAAILVAATAFNLLGDGLRDILDPKRVLSR